jgi:F-type H+-transporting ATPase subunit gamma
MLLKNLSHNLRLINMLSTRDIQRKIRTVINIQKITKAMKTVSNIKLRKAEERIKAASPYADALRGLVSRLDASDSNHPLMQRRNVQNALVVSVSADKGLAGSYNSTIIKETVLTAKKWIDEKINPLMVTVGRKVSDSIRRQGYEINTTVSPLGSHPEFSTIAALADYIGQLYIEQKVDQVDLIYTRFGEKVVNIRLLPLEPPNDDEPTGNYLYEPTSEEILNALLPRYLRTMLFTAVISSVASEHAARVAAMSLATENADEMITDLTLEYNKSRQAAITTELGDIVGAAEALR